MKISSAEVPPIGFITIKDPNNDRTIIVRVSDISALLLELGNSAIYLSSGASFEIQESTAWEIATSTFGIKPT